MHGDDDQIVPIVAAGPFPRTSEERNTQGLSGLSARHAHTNADQINADLLAFIKGAASASA